MLQSILTQTQTIPDCLPVLLEFTMWITGLAREGEFAASFVQKRDWHEPLSVQSNKILTWFMIFNLFQSQV